MPPTSHFVTISNEHLYYFSKQNALKLRKQLHAYGIGTALFICLDHARLLSETQLWASVYLFIYLLMNVFIFR